MILIELTDCPVFNAILTNATFPVAFVKFSVPNVILYAPLNVAFDCILSEPVEAQPLLPFPPAEVSSPGTPAPAY